MSASTRIILGLVLSVFFLGACSNEAQLTPKTLSPEEIKAREEMLLATFSKFESALAKSGSNSMENAISELAGWSHEELTNKGSEIVAGIEPLVAASGLPPKGALIPFLVKVGPDSLPVLRSGLQSADESVRIEAAKAMASLGLDGRRMLVASLESVAGDRTKVREVAIRAAFDSAKLPDPVMRVEAATLLGRISEDARATGPAGEVTCVGECEKAVVRLMELLKDKNPGVRVVALEVLGNLGPSAAMALPSVALLMKSIESEVGRAASDVVHQFGEAAIVHLTQLAADGKKEIRRAVAISLGRFESSSTQAYEALIPLTKDDQISVRVEAFRGLANLSRVEQARKSLFTGLEDESIRIQVLVVGLLGTGRLGAEGVAVLERLLTNSDPRIVLASLRSLGRLGHRAKVAADDVEKACSANLDVIRRAAIETLPKLVANSESLAVSLGKILSEGKDDKVRAKAAIALGDLGVEAASQSSLLRKAVTDLSPEVHTAAAESLLRIKEAGRVTGGG